MNMVENETLTKNRDHKLVRNYLLEIMVSMMWVRYSTTAYYHNELIWSIKNAVHNLRHLLEWNTTFQDLKLSDYTFDIMEAVYQSAIVQFQDTEEIDPGLKKNVKCLPKSCPWDLSELLALSPFLAIDKLPDPIDTSVQPILYQVLNKWYDEDRIDKARCEKPCDENCQWYKECIIRARRRKYLAGD